MTKIFDIPGGNSTEHTADNDGSRTRWSGADQIRTKLGLPATANDEETMAAWGALCGDTKFNDSLFESHDLPKPKDRERLEYENVNNRGLSERISSTAIDDSLANRGGKSLPYSQTSTEETIMADPKTYDVYNK